MSLPISSDCKQSNNSVYLSTAVVIKQVMPLILTEKIHISADVFKTYVYTQFSWMMKFTLFNFTLFCCFVFICLFALFTLKITLYSLHQAIHWQNQIKFNITCNDFIKHILHQPWKLVSFHLRESLFASQYGGFIHSLVIQYFFIFFRSSKKCISMELILLYYVMQDKHKNK